MKKLYKLTSVVALKVILWMYKHQSNNVVSMTTADRQQLLKDLNIGQAQFSNILKLLKAESIITGNSGKYYLSSEITDELQSSC